MRVRARPNPGTRQSRRAWAPVERPTSRHRGNRRGGGCHPGAGWQGCVPPYGAGRVVEGRSAPPCGYLRGTFRVTVTIAARRNLCGTVGKGLSVDRVVSFPAASYRVGLEFRTASRAAEPSARVPSETRDKREPPVAGSMPENPDPPPPVPVAGTSALEIAASPEAVGLPYSTDWGV